MRVPMRMAASATLLATVLALSGGAGAQETPKPAEAAKPAQPWIVECSNRTTGDALVCQMSQTLVAKNSGQRVLSAVIVKKAGGAYAMTLGLPHGLNLPAGVQLSIDDGEKLPVQIGTADQSGSYATLDISAKLLASLKKGAILNVTVKANAGGDLVLQLSLTGFGAALEKV